MHFAHLANALLKDEESARDNHALACNFAENLPISNAKPGCSPPGSPHSRACRHRVNVAQNSDTYLSYVPTSGNSTGNESVPIQLVQCRFHGLAISNAKILIHFFQTKHTEAIFFKQHPETVTT